MPEGAIVVFSAHGVVPAVHEEAARATCSTIDATCPLVTKVHNEAKRFAAKDYDILLIGHEGHEEVEGTAGEAPDHIRLVDGPDGVDEGRRCSDPNRVVWLSQTTLSVDETNETVARLRERFPNLIDPPSDDICYATQNRQIAVKEIAARVRPRHRRRLEQLLQLQAPGRGRQGRTAPTPSYLVDDASLHRGRRGSRASPRSASPAARRSPRSSSQGVLARLADLRLRPTSRRSSRSPRTCASRCRTSCARTCAPPPRADPRPGAAVLSLGSFFCSPLSPRLLSLRSFPFGPFPPPGLRARRGVMPVRPGRPGFSTAGRGQTKPMDGPITINGRQ